MSIIAKKKYWRERFIFSFIFQTEKMKSNKIVVERIEASAKRQKLNEKLCEAQTPKVSLSYVPHPSTLIKFADKDTIAKISNTVLGIEYVSQENVKFYKFLKKYAKNDIQVRDIVAKHSTIKNRKFDTLIRNPNVLKDITKKTKLHIKFMAQEKHFPKWVASCIGTLKIDDSVMKILTKQCFQSYLKNKEELAKIKEQHRINAIKLALYYFEMKLPIFNHLRYNGNSLELDNGITYYLKIAEVGINYLIIDQKIYILCQSKKDQQFMKFKQGRDIVWLHPIQKTSSYLFSKLHISELVENIIEFIIDK
jgi:hypothetical protein